MLLRCLGGLALEGSELRREKALLLLAYLAVEGPAFRRTLARQFEPESSDPMKALGMIITRIRQGAPGAISADALRAEAGVPCDVTAFEQAVQEGDLDAARALYRGPFLDGVRLRHCGLEVEEWLFATRERLEQSLRDLERRATRAAGDLQSSPVPIRSSGPSRRPYPVLPQLPPLPPLPDGPIVRPESERAVVKALRRSRLVTLTGMAGTGKSHLALTIAHRAAAAEVFPDGACFVPLETVLLPELVPSALARHLGIEPPPLVSVEQALVVALDRHELLIVLDNVEHLVGIEPFLAELLRGCTGLHLLLTSRNRLRFSDGATVTLKGLSVPPPGVSPASLRRYQAVRLFADRVKRLNPGFKLDARSAEAVATVCRSLEGLPLAIELAATWARLLDPDSLARSAALESPALAEAEPAGRHASLAAAFEHGWSLLGSELRWPLMRLSVFRGGFDLEAASAVAGAGMDVLAALVDRSVIRGNEPGRFSQHPLLREFGEEKLLAAGELDATAERHATWFLTPGNAQVQDLGQLDAANLRAAWSFAVSARRADLLTAGVPVLERQFGGRPRELARLLSEAIAAVAATGVALELRLRLALSPSQMSTLGYASPEVAANLARIQALGSAADLPQERFAVLWGLWGWHVVRGAIPAATELAAACAEVAAETGQAWLTIEAERMIAESALWGGAARLARKRYLTGIRLMRSLSDVREPPPLLDGHHPSVTMRSMLAIAHWCLGDAAEAYAASDEAVRTAESVAHPYGVAYSTTLAAVLGCMNLDHERTRRLGAAGERVSSAHGFAHWAAVGRLLQGWVACRENDLTQGSHDLEAGIAAWRATGAGHSLPFFFALLAESQWLRDLHHEALDTLDEALELVDAQDERWWEPELYRWRGVVKLSLRARAEAEADLRRAVSLAQLSGAVGWLQRADRSLAEVVERRDTVASDRLAE